MSEKDPYTVDGRVTTPNMLNEPYIIEELLKLLPRFREGWEEHCKLWEGEGKTLENDLSCFAQELLHSMKRGDDVNYNETFIFIDKLLIEGDDDIRNATILVSCHY